MSKAIRALQVQLQIEPERFYTGVLDGLYGQQTDLAIKEAISKGRFRLAFNYDVFRKLFNKKSITKYYSPTAENDYYELDNSKLFNIDSIQKY